MIVIVIGPDVVIEQTDTSWRLAYQGRVLPLTEVGGTFRDYLAWLRWLLSVAQSGLALDLRRIVETYAANNVAK